jgi:hypothetical protein
MKEKRKKKSCAIQVSYFGNWNYLISSLSPPPWKKNIRKKAERRRKKGRTGGKDQNGEVASSTERQEN